MMINLRFELHLLLHCFVADVDDPDRTAMFIDHLTHYYKNYNQSELRPAAYNCKDERELIALITDSVLYDAESKMLSEEHGMDTPHSIFAKLTEEDRRCRLARLEAGDETAKFCFPQQKLVVTRKEHVVTKKDYTKTINPPPSKRDSIPPPPPSRRESRTQSRYGYGSGSGSKRRYSPQRSTPPPPPVRTPGSILPSLSTLPPATIHGSRPISTNQQIRLNATQGLARGPPGSIHNPYGGGILGNNNNNSQRSSQPLPPQNDAYRGSGNNNRSSGVGSSYEQRFGGGKRGAPQGGDRDNKRRRVYGNSNNNRY